MIKEMEMTVREGIKIAIEMNKTAVAKLITPFAIASAIMIFLYLADPVMFAKCVAVFGVYAFMPLIGPLSVIPVGLGLGIHPVALISFITFTDAVLSLFLVWNFDYAKRIPGIGEHVKRIGERGEKALNRYKWAKRFGFIGLVAFLILPVQWTGAGVGSIVGRLIGMSSLMTWLAVITGTFISSTFVTLACLGVVSLF